EHSGPMLAPMAETLQANSITLVQLAEDFGLVTMEEVLGRVDKIILDDSGNGAGQGVVPYLPLNELRRAGGTN
ncbi:MAG: hypothetical protein AAF330_06695, partial [Pseudomonadota bacterium]